MNRAIHRLVTIALSATLVTGCSSAQEPATVPQPEATGRWPVEIENCNHPVKVPAPPSRAVSIDQSATELLLSLGLQDRMVGTAGWNDPVLPELADANSRVPRIGELTPSLERVLADNPDFVYATFNWSFTDEGVGPRKRFKDVGVTTYQSPSECEAQTEMRERALTIDDLYGEITDIATIFGVRDRGDQLISQMRSRVRAATKGVQANSLRLMWWYAATKTPYLAGCCGAPGVITDAVGAENAFDDSRQYWPEISWESILERDPDVLILADLTRGEEGDSAAAKISFLETNPVARQLTAVRERRWIILPGSAMDPSVRNIGAIETVASGLRKLGVVGG